MPAADRHTADVDDRVVHLEVTTHELERADDRDGALDTRKRLEGKLGDGGPVADRADNGPALARGDVSLGADVTEPFGNMLDIGRRRVGLHDDDHGLVGCVRGCGHVLVSRTWGAVSPRNRGG